MRRKPSPPSVDRRIADIAALQHGVFTRAQAMSCGATEGALTWRLKVGRWQRLYRNVYKLSGSPTTWRQRATAACFYMGRGAAVSYRAAATLGRLDGFLRARVEVSVRRSRNRSGAHGIIIHLLREPIPPDDITTIDGIPVTKPARTLLDIASTEPEQVIERALDDALRRRLVSLPFLERWLADPRRSRHRGAPVLRRLIEARAIIGVTESPLETEVLTLLRKAGLPIPMLQYELRDGDRFIARLDLTYPHERVAIEVDGFRYHDDRRTFDAERARTNDIQALGWRVLRVTSKHLEEDSDAVVAWVRRALG